MKSINTEHDIAAPIEETELIITKSFLDGGADRCSHQASRDGP